MICDTASTRIECSAKLAFDFMSAPENMSLWSFGTWRARVEADGLVRGTSIKDGSPVCVRIVPDRATHLIDYHVGSDPDVLVPRIFVRIAQGSVLGGTDAQCLLMMTALRDEDMSNARWDALKRAHAFEVDLIKAALETGYDHRNG